jgi:hypothetical protein
MRGKQNCFFNFSLRKTLESFSKGNLDFNFFREFYEKCQYEVDLRKHMMTANQLVDCLFYIISYGTPSLPFILSSGKELTKREFSKTNFMHTNRLLKVFILLKTYFKDPLFISDPEWKESAVELFETYKQAYLHNLCPVLEFQFRSFKKSSFNAKLYFDNLGFVCFLNTVFQEYDNQKHLISSAEIVARYHCLWYSFFRSNDNTSEFLLEQNFEDYIDNGKYLIKIIGRK